MRWYIDQVQIDFAIRLVAHNAKETRKLLSNILFSSAQIESGLLNILQTTGLGTSSERGFIDATEIHYRHFVLLFRLFILLEKCSRV